MFSLYLLIITPTLKPTQAHTQSACMSADMTDSDYLLSIMIHLRLYITKWIQSATKYISLSIVKVRKMNKFC